MLLLVGLLTVGSAASAAPASAQSAPPAQPLAPPPLGESQAIISVYQQASPAVVNISFISQALDVFGNRVLQEASGSGVILDQQGDILTNEHVVSGASQLDITLPDGSIYAGQIIATDPAIDLALLSLQAPAAVLAQLTVASLGDSSTLQVGQQVLAIGNPFGFERSASRGIVSSLGRTLPGEQNRFITNMIQTDAAINPGNSGGPLLDMSGQVVGINEQIASSSDTSSGVGFAIPINTVKRYLPDLLAGRQPQHAWLGVSGLTLTPSRARALRIGVQQGVILAAVASGGPAAAAGLRGVRGNDVSTADVITALDGVPVRREEEIAAFVDQHQPGDSVEVQFIRGGQPQTANVVLGTWRPQNAGGS